MNGNANIEKIRRSAKAKEQRDDMKRDWKRKRNRAKLNSLSAKRAA